MRKNKPEELILLLINGVYFTCELLRYFYFFLQFFFFVFLTISLLRVRGYNILVKTDLYIKHYKFKIILNLHKF